MPKEFCQSDADLVLEQLAPEDAYLSCELKSMQPPVLSVAESLKLTEGVQTTMYDVCYPTHRYNPEAAQKS